jgi:hypothetical protein
MTPYGLMGVLALLMVNSIRYGDTLTIHFGNVANELTIVSVSTALIVFVFAISTALGNSFVIRLGDSPRNEFIRFANAAKDRYRHHTSKRNLITGNLLQDDDGKFLVYRPDLNQQFLYPCSDAIGSYAFTTIASGTSMCIDGRSYKSVASYSTDEIENSHIKPTLVMVTAPLGSSNLEATYNVFADIFPSFFSYSSSNTRTSTSSFGDTGIPINVDLVIVDEDTSSSHKIARANHSLCVGSRAVLSDSGFPCILCMAKPGNLVIFKRDLDTYRANADHIFFEVISESGGLCLLELTEGSYSDFVFSDGDAALTDFTCHHEFVVPSHQGVPDGMISLPMSDFENGVQPNPYVSFFRPRNLDGSPCPVPVHRLRACGANWHKSEARIAVGSPNYRTKEYCVTYHMKTAAPTSYRNLSFYSQHFFHDSFESFQHLSGLPVTCQDILHLPSWILPYWPTCRCFFSYLVNSQRYSEMAAFILFSVFFIVPVIDCITAVFYFFTIRVLSRVTDYRISFNFMELHTTPSSVSLPFDFDDRLGLVKVPLFFSHNFMSLVGDEFSPLIDYERHSFSGWREFIFSSQGVMAVLLVINGRLLYNRLVHKSPNSPLLFVSSTFLVVAVCDAASLIRMVLSSVVFCASMVVALLAILRVLVLCVSLVKLFNVMGTVVYTNKTNVFDYCVNSVHRGFSHNTHNGCGCSGAYAVFSRDIAEIAVAFSGNSITVHHKTCSRLRNNETYFPLDPESKQATQVEDIEYLVEVSPPQANSEPWFSIDYKDSDRVSRSEGFKYIIAWIFFFFVWFGGTSPNDLVYRLYMSCCSGIFVGVVSLRYIISREGGNVFPIFFNTSEWGPVSSIAELFCADIRVRTTKVDHVHTKCDERLSTWTYWLWQFAAFEFMIQFVATANLTVSFGGREPTSMFLAFMVAYSSVWCSGPSSPSLDALEVTGQLTPFQRRNRPVVLEPPRFERWLLSMLSRVIPLDFPSFMGSLARVLTEHFFPSGSSNSDVLVVVDGVVRSSAVCVTSYLSYILVCDVDHPIPKLVMCIMVSIFWYSMLDVFNEYSLRITFHVARKLHLYMYFLRLCLVFLLIFHGFVQFFSLSTDVLCRVNHDIGAYFFCSYVFFFLPLLSYKFPERKLSIWANLAIFVSLHFFSFRDIDPLFNSLRGILDVNGLSFLTFFCALVVASVSYRLFLLCWTSSSISISKGKGSVKLYLKPSFLRRVFFFLSSFLSFFSPLFFFFFFLHFYYSHPSGPVTNGVVHCRWETQSQWQCCCRTDTTFGPCHGTDLSRVFYCYFSTFLYVFFGRFMNLHRNMVPSTLV